MASIASPLAGADVAAPPAPPRAGVAATTSPVTLPSLGASSVLSAVGDPEMVTRKLPIGGLPAPADPVAISSLSANGIPAVALNAYRVAAARLRATDPGCGIEWSLLAGIGRVESDHGRFGGAVLGRDGVSVPKIIGPALDGVIWDKIAAPPDGLELAGDAVYAHALGPMQFIPSTWDIYGVDATGDGVADIFNINDVALAAARYLCAAGGDLRTQDGLRRAVLAYNHNDQYLAQVLALAAAYKAGTPITGLPLGITTGTLPRIKNPGPIPPVNPGGPDRSRPAPPPIRPPRRSDRAAARRPSRRRRQVRVRRPVRGQRPVRLRVPVRRPVPVRRRRRARTLLRAPAARRRATRRPPTR